MTSTDSDAPKNEYIIDIEMAAETARLVEQDKLFTQAMGGLLPELSDLSQVEHLLDIGCGPGGWAIEVAYKYPDIEVMGVDINRTMVNYARAIAKSQGLKNVLFDVMNVREGLEFDDNTFDLINARFILGFMDIASWPVLLAECMRVLKPGGIIRFSEGEMVSSSSAAVERLTGCIWQALTKQGRSFSRDGRSAGIACMFPTLFHHAGFQQIKQRAFLLDSSYRGELYSSSYREYEITFILLKPYLVGSGVIDEEEYDRQYNTMQIDMLRDDFTAISFGITALGVKPT